jgi:hypothetical protein
MSDRHSAVFGEAWLVEIEWNTDYENRRLPDHEPPARTLHGPFDTPEEATEWLHTYPDDPDIYEMTVVVINKTGA